MFVFKMWMRAATTEEQELMAEGVRKAIPKSKMSRNYLHQLAGGFRDASAELGAVIERLSTPMALASKGRLPRIYRTDLVEACHGCEYAQKCLGPAAVRGDFPVVTSELVAEVESGARV